MIQPFWRGNLARCRCGPLPVVILALFVGCGPSGGASRTVEVDPDAAREALSTALDAWKDGQPHGTIARTSASPIRVADEDWLAGATLEDYALEPGDQIVGGRWNCPVTLTLRTPQGQARTMRVAYLVATEPELSVIRQD